MQLVYQFFIVQMHCPKTQNILETILKKTRRKQLFINILENSKYKYTKLFIVRILTIYYLSANIVEKWMSKNQSFYQN